MLIDFWWSYITIFLCYMVTFLFRSITVIFHPDFETNRKYSFLVAIPEAPAGPSSLFRRACLVSQVVESLATWNELSRTNNID